MSKTVSRKHVRITEPGTSKRNYKNKPLEERNPNPSKIKHGLFSKNQVKYDPRMDVYTKAPIHYNFCTRCGTRCHSGDGMRKNFSKNRRNLVKDQVSSQL